MKFYYPNGTPNENMEDFTREFRKYYFLNNQIDDTILPKKLSQSSEHVERVISDLLEKGISKKPDEGKRDVARILAWKIGKIDHKNSKKSFKYVRGWENAEELKGVNNPNGHPIEKAVLHIVENWDNLAQKDPKNFINELNSLEDQEMFNGIGTVYMITLLYFMSQKKYPIYDRFAHKAVKAIYYDANPYDIYIDYAPSKKEVDKFLRQYNEFCWLLQQVFGTYSIDREYDQALWVYGHANIKNIGGRDSVSNNTFKIIDFD